jgi:hypothetical protein
MEQILELQELDAPEAADDMLETSRAGHSGWWWGWSSLSLFIC